MPFTAPADELLAPSKSFRAPDDEVVKPAFVAPTDEVVNLSKIQATPVNQPSQFSSGLPASVPIADNPDWAFTKATRGGLPGLTQDAMAAGMGAVGDVTAFAMNNLNRPLQWAGVPIPNVESGKPIIPDEALPLAKEKGVIPALTRILQGFTTPENIALLPLAVESKAIQGAFLAQSGMALPDAANKVLSAKTPEEQRDAGTELVANLAMAALMAKGMSGKAAPEAPRTAAPEPPAAPAAESGFTAPADEVVAPAQPPAPFNPVAEAQNQLRSESKGTAAPGGETINTPVIGEQTPPAPTVEQVPRGTIKPVENVPQNTPTIAEKAAAAPSQPVTLADLAQLQAEMRGNQLKPSEPAKPSPPVPAEAAAPAALPGQSDFTRYQELTASLKGKSMDDAQPILSEIEAIKNRNGGMTPTEPSVSPASKSETQSLKSETLKNFQDELKGGGAIPVDSKSQHDFSPSAPKLKNAPLGEKPEAGEWNDRPKEVAINQTDNGISHFAEEKFTKGYKIHRFVFSKDGKGVSYLQVLEFPERQKGEPYSHSPATPAASNLHLAYTLPEFQRKGIASKLIQQADSYFKTPLQAAISNTKEMRGLMQKLSQPEVEATKNAPVSEPKATQQPGQSYVTGEKIASQSEASETGKQVPSTRGEDVLHAAVERKLIEALPELPTHVEMNVSKETAKAIDFIKSNPEEALRISQGEEGNSSVRPEAVYTAMEEKAVREGDAETLLKLSQSKLPTEAGQRLKLLDSKDPNSPVKIMRDIRETREAIGERRAKTTKAKVVNEIKSTMRRTRSSLMTWDQVVNKIICN